MPVGELLSGQVARIQEAVNSVYTPRELDDVTSRPRELKYSSTGIDWADSDSASESSLESIASGEADDVFCTRRRAKDLHSIVTQGRGRIRRLEKRLMTQQRMRVIKSLSDWFEGRVPEIARAEQDLDTLETSHSDEKVDKVCALAAEAKSAMEDEALHVREQMDHFFHQFMDEVCSKPMREKTANTLTMLKEYEDQDDEKDEAKLQKANKELERLQHQVNMTMGLEPEDESADDVRQQIQDLKEAIAAKKTRCADLQRSVDEHGHQNFQLQEILSALRMEHRGGLVTRDAGLQKMAASLREKVAQGAQAQIEQDETTVLRKTQAESEDREAERQEMKLKELEDETKTKLEFVRLVMAEDKVAMQEEEEEDEETSKKLQEEQSEAYHELRTKRSALKTLEEENREARAKASRLETARREVRRKFRQALEKLRHEEEESIIAEASSTRPEARTPAEFRRLLQERLKFARRHPRLFACGMGLVTISDEGDDYIMGCSDDGEAGQAMHLSIADSEGGAFRRSSHTVQEHATMLHSQLKLWASLDALSEDLCLSVYHSENDRDQDEDWQRRVYIEQLQEALTVENMIEGGNLVSIAEDGMRDVFGIEWLTQRLAPMAKRTPRPFRPHSPRGNRSPRGRR